LNCLVKQSGCNANESLKSKNYNSQTTISVSAGGNAEIYADTCWFLQEDLFTYGVQNKSIKKHFEGIIIENNNVFINFNGKRYFSWSSLGIF
jgi:hypothetical protein